MQKAVRKILRAVADYDPDYYDMYADPNEAWFARLYVERILRHAAEADIRAPATEPGTPPAAGSATGVPSIEDRRPTLLEAGCQAGRLVVPLAKRGFQVTGIDTSAFALRRAREHARAAGVTATFVQGDLIKVLRRSPRRRFDIVVCAEVVYLSPQYREMLEALAAAVRPGGLLCVSHRPKFYYLLEALRQYDLATAAEVLRKSEGPFRDARYYNWQTEEELRALYRSLGLVWIAMHPIDRLAWLGGISLDRLTEEQRGEWLRWELEQPGEAAGTCARYVLVVAAQPGAADGSA